MFTKGLLGLLFFLESGDKLERVRGMMLGYGL